MRLIQAEKLQEIGTRFLDAAGSPHEESQIVSEILVRSSLVGHDSHGVIRYKQYVSMLHEGAVVPGAPFEIVHEAKASAVVDGHQGWGPVVAQKAMHLAIEKARQSSVGTVVARGCQHVGRVGEYPSMAVPEGMIGIAVVNSFGYIGSVAPWGGIDGRLSPNPIAFASPSGAEWTLLVDITTSVVPEGKVRVALSKGEQLPESCIIDHEGNPITDPATFYGPPFGAILPLGGPVGHKGTGLGIMTELLAGALSTVGFCNEDAMPKGNGLFFQAINISDFLPMERYIELVQELIEWTKSSRRMAGVEEILIPGEPEYRTLVQRRKEGIPVEDALWRDINELAHDLGVTID